MRAAGPGQSSRRPREPQGAPFAVLDTPLTGRPRDPLARGRKRWDLDRAPAGSAPPVPLHVDPPRRLAPSRSAHARSRFVPASRARPRGLLDLAPRLPARQPRRRRRRRGVARRARRVVADHRAGGAGRAAAGHALPLPRPGLRAAQARDVEGRALRRGLRRVHDQHQLRARRERAAPGAVRRALGRRRAGHRRRRRRLRLRRRVRHGRPARGGERRRLDRRGQARPARPGRSASRRRRPRSRSSAPPR